MIQDIPKNRFEVRTTQTHDHIAHDLKTKSHQDRIHRTTHHLVNINNINNINSVNKSGKSSSTLTKNNAQFVASSMINNNNNDNKNDERYGSHICVEK